VESRRDFDTVVITGISGEKICQFNRSRRLLSPLNLEIFTLHHCAMNRGCGGWVSSFVIVCYGYVSGEAICPSMWFQSR